MPRLLLLLALLLGGCATSAPLPTVSSVDLSRYAGTWYEIARLPNRFQRGCIASQATYTARPDGALDVLNRCRLDRPDGEIETAHAVAWPTDASHAKLAVQFMWPFRGDYWIIALDPDYGWAVVGTPSRETLWILSRTPTMRPTLYDRLVERAQTLGFDTTALVRTAAPAP
jgi:apolipoprotein D and lipocalin family protein